jgi:hypothetical protein
MKRTLFAAVVAVAVAGSAMAQGIVTFTASGVNRPVSYSLDSSATNKVKFPVGSPSTIPGFGQLNVTLYAASAGTPLLANTDGSPNLAGWFIADTVVHTINSIDGQINATPFAMNAALGAPGTPVQLTVVGWTGSFTDFQSAYAAGTALVGWTGSLLSTGQRSWLNNTGTSQTPAVAVTGVNGYNGLVLTPVPEPATIALGGLGIAALLLFRRRK